MRLQYARIKVEHGWVRGTDPYLNNTIILKAFDLLAATANSERSGEPVFY